MYRQERNYENLNKAIYDGAGPYQMPQVLPEHPEGVDGWIGFNYAKSCKDPTTGKGIHFFLDDYQFNRLWTYPDRYLDLLRQFRCVMTPGFSMYLDFPVAAQIWNAYRRRWLGAYWQEHGITVIPTIMWGREDSFDWSFDGDPVGGAVAVSSVGTQFTEYTRGLFLEGYKEMLARLRPSTIYFYGKLPPECAGPNVVPITPFYMELKKRAGTV